MSYSVNSLSKINAAQLYQDVKNLDEKGVVRYVAQNYSRFDFNSSVVKIKKAIPKGFFSKIFNLKQSNNRSDVLARSLVVMQNGTIFHTGKIGNTKKGSLKKIKQKNEIGSRPGGKDAVVLGAGDYKTVFKVRNLVTNQFLAVAVG